MFKQLFFVLLKYFKDFYTKYFFCKKKSFQYFQTFFQGGRCNQQSGLEFLTFLCVSTVNVAKLVIALRTKHYVIVPVECLGMFRLRPRSNQHGVIVSIRSSIGYESLAGIIM